MGLGEIRNGVVDFPAASVMAIYTRVKFNAGKVEPAGLAEASVGTLHAPALEADKPVAVRLWNDTGTRLVIAGVAIAQGELVYGAANGQVSNVSAGAGQPLGVAREAATVVGQHFVIAPIGREGE